MSNESRGMRHRLILLAHRSPDPNWRRPFTELSQGLQARLGESAVRLAFMEFAAPTLLDVACEAAADGLTSLSVLPLFLAAGSHLSTDIPGQIAEASKNFAQLRIELLPHVAEDRRVQALFHEIAGEYSARGREESGETEPLTVTTVSNRSACSSRAGFVFVATEKDEKRSDSNAGPICDPVLNEGSAPP